MSRNVCFPLFIAVFASAAALSGASPTTTALSANTATATYGQQVQFTATVTPAPSDGSVTFFQGTAIIGVSPVSGGTAALQTALLLPGVRPVRAYYSGNASFLPSTSTPVAVTVNALPGNGFFPAVVYPTNNLSVSVAITDLNKDGFLDLITADSAFDGTITVLIGNGDGTFRPKVTYSGGFYPSHVLVGDFNRDGNPDIVFGNAAGKPVNVMLGDGAGHLGARYEIGMPSSFSLAIGDFNGDGKHDLAGVDPGSNIVNVALGNGDGTFSAAAPISSPSGPICLSVVDLNVDGFADLAVVNKISNQLSIHLGLGNGTFAAPVNYSLGTGPQDNNGSWGTVQADDFNRDGKLDLIVPDPALGIVNVLLGNGDGTLQPRHSFPTGVYPFQVRHTDLNGDGLLDLVVNNGDPGSMSTLIGNGDGTFQGPTTYSIPQQYPNTINTADFNRDGVADVVLGSYFSSVEVMLGRPAPASTTIASAPAGLSFTADGTTYIAPHTFNWAAGSAHTISWTTPIAGAPGSRLSFSGWSDGDTTNPRSYTAAASSSTLTANFTSQYLLTTTAGSGGAISPSTGWFDAGSSVAVSATASPGYQFTAFTGDLSGSTTPQSVLMSAPRSVNASFALNGQAVVRLVDSAGSPLPGGTVTYYNNGWKPFGVTDATGQAALTVPAGSYTFNVVYASTQQQITQNTGVNPLVVFQTRSVTVQLKNSSGALMDTGVAQYYSNGWNSFGSTTGGQVRKELLPGSYTFSLTYLSGSQQLTQDVAANPVVVFQTKGVTVQLKDSLGNPLDTGTVQYYANGWLSFGSTSGGQVSKELLASSYTFALTYLGIQQQQSQNVGSNPLIVFQTTGVTVQLKNSSGNPLDTGTVQYYANGWVGLGSTAGGQVSKELLAGTYTFALTYLGIQLQQSQNVGSNPVVVFQTKGVTVQLKDSNGIPLDTGSVQYYANGWVSLGSTAGGQVSKELLAGTYTFALTYAAAQQQIAQDVASNPVVVFQTKAATVLLKDSAGNPLDTGTVQYYANGWLSFGQTSGGQAVKELLPGVYPIRMTYANGQSQLTQDIRLSATIAFQTGKVHSGTGACVNYYANGWQPFTNDMELLPGSYTFRFNDGTPDAISSVSAAATTPIH